MQSRNFQYLQSVDGFEVYIPYTKQLLQTNSFFELIAEIYASPQYSFVGSVLVLFVYMGKLSALIDGELYVNLQLSIMIFAAWVPVVIYRLLYINGISKEKAYRYTLIYSLCSVHFITATLLVRDMPITLFYTIIIYLTFKTYSVKNVSIMILLILLTMTIRLSSGIFVCLFLVALILLNNYQNISPGKKISTFLFLGGVMAIAVVYFNDVVDVFTRNQSAYGAAELADQGGDSTKAAFNNLPIGISQFFKMVYNQFMQIPSWRKMMPTKIRNEVYNVMNFPEIYTTLFRYCMWLFVVIGLFTKRIRAIVFSNKVLLINFCISILFLMLQSDTLGHRRMLGVYPIFFLIFCLILQNLSTKNKRTIFSLSIGVFLIFQLIGFIYIL